MIQGHPGSLTKLGQDALLVLPRKVVMNNNAALARGGAG